MAQDTATPLRISAISPTRKLVSATCAIALAGSCGAFPLAASAEDIDTNPSPDALQQEVERTAAAYDEALAQVDEAALAIDEQAERIAELEELIPAQQARSEAAARELYKFEQQTPGILDFLLGSNGVYDLLNNIDYVNRITEANVAEVNRLNELRAELDSSMASLEQAKADADARASEAEAALSAAQEARMEAQRRAEEAARQEAEAAAAAAAAAQAAQASQAKAEQQSAEAASPQEQQPAEVVVGEAAAVVATPVSDGADWSDDQASFISNWAPRIDAYLAGSALAGQGTAFAQAAWSYGVDPRWSPAISCIESSKGDVCFLPHNAWGWGGESWGSWEEAIDAHVRGLARGYGYTVSIEAAQRYCPPNWQNWYDSVLAQMNMI